MSNLPSADDVLMGGGSAPPAAEWAQPGSRVEGTIVGKPRSYHAREFAANGQAGDLKYFPSGDPILGVMVDIQTPLRGPDDNGIRRLYVESQRMMTAVRDAVRVAGAAGLEAGAWISVVWTGTEQGKGTIPAKTWVAEYRRASQAPVTLPNAPTPAPTPAPAGNPWDPAPAVQTLPQQALAQAQQYAAAQGYAPTYAGTPVAATPAPPATPAPQRVVTESLAAAMRNAGVDVSGFTVIPG